MKLCERHGIVFLGGHPCPVCESEAEIRRHEVEAEGLRKFLGETLDTLEMMIDDNPCRYDHNGLCQTHRLNNPCEMQLARALLVLAGRRS